MSIHDDPFQENDANGPEKEKDRLESLESGPSTDDDDVIELTDASGDEDVLELKETVDFDSEEDEIIDLMDAEISTPEEESIIELDAGAITEPEEEEDVLDLTVEAPAEIEPDEDILDLTAEAPAETETDEDVLDLTAEAPAETEADEDVLDLTAEAPAETEAAPEATDEGREIMELIDDIQSTLDKTGEKEPDVEAELPAASIEEPAEDGEEPFEKSIILGDEETLDPVELSESESEFVDHIGLDLTSEFSKEIFGEESIAPSVAIDPQQLEETVERVFNKMLSDESSPLVQAITKAVQKEIRDKNT